MDVCRSPRRASRAASEGARQRDPVRATASPLSFRSSFYSLARKGPSDPLGRAVYGSSIDVLGSMYSVNRATAARWLAAARRSLMDGARARLRAQLRLSESECDSLVALVRSSLDISIVKQLSEN